MSLIKWALGLGAVAGGYLLYREHEDKLAAEAMARDAATAAELPHSITLNLLPSSLTGVLGVVAQTVHVPIAAIRDRFFEHAAPPAAVAVMPSPNQGYQGATIIQPQPIQPANNGSLAYGDTAYSQPSPDTGNSVLIVEDDYLDSDPLDDNGYLVLAGYDALQVEARLSPAKRSKPSPPPAAQVATEVDEEEEELPES